MSTRDLSKMTVVQLREQLRSRGLPTDGTKAALIERLKGSYAVEDTILNSDASASKDILEETVLEGAINEDDILGPDISAKKKEDLAPAATVTAPAAISSAHITGESKTNRQTDVNKKTEAINSLDTKLKRAQRFGLPLSDKQMKQKRAERFGMQNINITTNVSEILAEKKKKRVERFGIVNETEKMQEILDKRAKRFGIDNKTHAAIGKVEKASLEVLEKRGKRFGLCSEEAELEIKKQRRAERFGLDKN
uniref:SAP domain-containing protein n=1 Tax=Onchocerca volvulus TaxID=6282 RepID=A0A8R1U211_ONCVO